MILFNPKLSEISFPKFPKAIRTKVNIIRRLEFLNPFSNIAIQYIILIDIKYLNILTSFFSKFIFFCLIVYQPTWVT